MLFKKFLEEQPTNSGGNPQAYSNAAAAEGPVAGFDRRLFPTDDDLLSQDFQTPAETGLRKWQLGSGVYPVMKVSLKSNEGDGPSIDSMVDASKEFVNMQDEKTMKRIRKNLSSFMEEAQPKKCSAGKYWCYTDKKCKKIPRGYHLGYRGYLEPDSENKKNGKNGNGSNGHSNGNGSSNGGSSGNGNGNGSGNGGGNGGGGGE